MLPNKAQMTFTLVAGFHWEGGVTGLVEDLYGHPRGDCSSSAHWDSGKLSPCLPGCRLLRDLPHMQTWVIWAQSPHPEALAPGPWVRSRAVGLQS